MTTHRKPKPMIGGHVPPALKKRFVRIAEQQDRSYAYCLREAVNDYCNKHEAKK